MILALATHWLSSAMVREVSTPQRSGPLRNNRASQKRLEDTWACRAAHDTASSWDVRGTHMNLGVHTTGQEPSQWHSPVIMAQRHPKEYFKRLMVSLRRGGALFVQANQGTPALDCREAFEGSKASGKTSSWHLMWARNCQLFEVVPTGRAGDMLPRSADRLLVGLPDCRFCLKGALASHFTFSSSSLTVHDSTQRPYVGAGP